MRTPYRTAAARSIGARGAARRGRFSGLAIACAFIWIASVARLVVASIHDERIGAEVALATLLVVGPPAVLLSRAGRDAMREDVAPHEDHTGELS